ncbi:tetratricopeptide repeat protein [Carboxylicivirga sediminis]|uniref:Tetratricopeptide repeat protein n=1 Tax=Carboxylicivirga sediminis TaxID=2006564 RepID=A0A941F7V9_9BACT|nr:tetratricopeptide repeat protein [Carboxylicivirga sediminis]MBR8538353.1 tetratricopeptide repeat protein [Carboxylicivirga sediminis]
MKSKRNLVFLISSILIPTGILLRVSGLNFGALSLVLGFLGFLIVFIIELITARKRNRTSIEIVMYVLIVLMSVSLFTRYLYYIFGDYPSLIIVPLFIVATLLYLATQKHKDPKLVSISLLYLVLTIPLFGLDFHKSPRQLFPQSWYNRLGDVDNINVTLPYQFQLQTAKELYNNASNAREHKDYFQAIIFYQKARNLEPYNPTILFDLAETYVRINELETGVALLDTAIMIDSTYAGFYNNRGLYYYKLNDYDKAISDYLKAIEIDSVGPTSYANLALVYYYKDMHNEARKALKQAESKGLIIKQSKEIQKINKILNE